MVTHEEAPPEPPQTLSDPRDLLTSYLDFHRDAALRKLDGLPERELRASRLPSGWSPLELLKHLAHVERRWFRWGFMAEQVDAPWGDRGADDRWQVGDDETVDDIRSLFLDECERARRIVAAARLTDTAATGGRFSPQEPPPTLIWIMFHVLQEYARHVGQLDVVRELADGVIGE